MKYKLLCNLFVSGAILAEEEEIVLTDSEFDAAVEEESAEAAETGFGGVAEDIIEQTPVVYKGF